MVKDTRWGWGVSKSFCFFFQKEALPFLTYAAAKTPAYFPAPPPLPPSETFRFHRS
jgi:hypothetical protein